MSVNGTKTIACRFSPRMENFWHHLEMMNAVSAGLIILVDLLSVMMVFYMFAMAVIVVFYCSRPGLEFIISWSNL